MTEHAGLGRETPLSIFVVEARDEIRGIIFVGIFRDEDDGAGDAVLDFRLDVVHVVLQIAQREFLLENVSLIDGSGETRQRREITAIRALAERDKGEAMI